MKTVRVDASEKYDVIISRGILSSAGEYARGLVHGSVAAVVTDDIVDGLYAGELEKALCSAGFRVLKFVMPNGEKSKNAENYIALLNFLARERLSRSDVVIALGGGVVGDLAGFAAATYMRGIRFIQIPTTLLAMVDSSVGGKTAIDLEAGKNLAGAFHQPVLVLCDCSLLATLSPEIFRDGYAEVIKYGIIAGGELFDMLKSPIEERLEEVIAACVEIKRDIVCEDEYETGARKLLNLGHTVGHAVEACSAYAVSHGAAVAAGMTVVARAAERMGWCAGECRREIVELVKAYGLPDVAGYDAGTLYRAALSDKKRDGDSITLVIPKAIGECVLKDVPIGELERLIGLGLEDWG